MPKPDPKLKSDRTQDTGKAVSPLNAATRADADGNPPSISASDAEISGNFGRRVKELRSELGWSLERLANASHVSRSMLSEIERERANPTLAVTYRIARAFGLTVGDLIRDPEATSRVTVIRANDRAYHYRSDNDCRIRTLSPLHLEKDVEFYEVELKPGGVLKSAAHFEGTREFLTVEEGRVRIESEGEGELLDQGDSAHYRADVPHSIENAGESRALLFLVDIYR